MSTNNQQSRGARSIGDQRTEIAEPKFTPGPWAVKGLNENLVYAKDGFVADVHGGTKGSASTVAKANAHLIAAAPELLAHVKLLEKTIEYEIRRSKAEGDDEGARLKTFTLYLVRDSIAKAEGRS